MAPAGESTYLPPLSACFSGESKLLTWKTVALELDASAFQALDRTVASYIEDSAALQILTNCFTLTKPTAQTKAQFESLTSAINVTPTSDNRYDIKEVKEDSLWLSQAAQIDEVQALRHTILEWQSRTGRQAALNLEEGALKDFTSVKARRQRLLEIYFEEQQWLFRCVEVIVARGVSGTSQKNTNAKPHRAIAAVAKTLSKSWHLDSTGSKQDGSWLQRTQNYLQSQVEAIESGKHIFSSNSMQDYVTEALYATCIETSAVLVIHGLRIILLIQWSLPRPVSPHLVMEWFQWMDTTAFFAVWLSQMPSLFAHHRLQVSELLILCSLAFIDIATTYELLPDLASISTAGDSQDAKVYLQNIKCVTELNRILGDNVEAGNQVAAPVAIAWCSLLNAVHIYASQSIEHRENRQTQKAIDMYGANQQSDNESVDGSLSRRRVSPNRRHSFGSDTSGQATLFEDIDEIIRSHPLGEDAVKHFGDRSVVELGGFAIIESIAQTSLARFDYDTFPELVICITEILVQFVNTSIELGVLGYSQTALDIMFVILAGRDGHWKYKAMETALPYPFGETNQAAGQDVLLQNIMINARGRFPYEDVPLIKLCRILLPYQNFDSEDTDTAVDILSNMTTLTTLVPEDFVNYELIGEGDGLQILLPGSTDALSMSFPGLLHDHSSLESDASESIIIPGGFKAQPLRDDKPLVALWNLDYSALKYCGLTLQLQLQWRAKTKQGSIEAEYSRLYVLNTEAVGLLATCIMKSSSKSQGGDPLERAQELLASVSDGLDRNQDVIAVIFALLEGELYKSRPDASETDFLLRCLQFLVALSEVMPSRVWSFLSRSGLLGLHGQENRLIAIVAAAEMSAGMYDILLTSLQLFGILIKDAVRGATTTTPQTTSVALKRFRPLDADSSGSGAQPKSVKEILEQFTKIFVDVLETSSSWTFKTQEHELSLKLGIYRSLQRIISYSFDYDDESPPPQRLSASLQPAVDYILDNFLSESTSDTLLSPLFKEFLDLVIEPSTSLMSRISILRQSVVQSSLTFINQLLRLNKFLDHATSNLTKKIYENIFILINLFTQSQQHRLAVVRTIEAAIRDSGSGTQATPIFASISEASAKAFVQSLSTLGLSKSDPSLAAATWSLFSAVITNNQQWAAVYLILGKTPKESLKGTKDSSPKSTIQQGLHKIVDLENMSTQESLELLKFVAHAANHWTFVTIALRNHKDCRNSCLKYLSELREPNHNKETDVAQPVKFQIAAYIVNILALLVHQSNHHKDTTTLRHLVPNIKYLVEYGASSPNYNASLHHGLAKNFQRVFPGSNLQHFKRTAFSQPQLGPEFYYDKSLADAMFPYNPAWAGRDGKGFNNEFVRANTNLSLVEAQVNLFHSWKSLAIELSEGLGDDAGFQHTMISIIKNCLKANQGSTMPEAIFTQLCVSRADLAFSLLQKLLAMNIANEEMRGILPLAWKLLQSQITDLGIALVGEASNYVRTLLRILYLSLCTYGNHPTDKASSDDTSIAIALDVLQAIVAQGFRSLIEQLHEGSDNVYPADFALIIGILRAALSIPGVTNHSERLLAHFADEKTIQYAGTLVSWSDQLISNGDPIYGELSIIFLLELSTVQPLAEAIVVNGTLSQIASTTLFSYFRRPGGVGPFDAPTRMYEIWSCAFLPLVINILGAVGPPVAIEIATLFDQFTSQLKRASLQFDPKASGKTNGRVTLSMINEAHSLTLLTLVMNKYREAGSNVGIISTELPQLQWDASSVKEDLESLLGRRHTLRDSIVPANEKEDSWSNLKPLRQENEAQTRLEEKVVEELHSVLSLMGAND